jgi:hypothetical protein
MTSKNRNRGLQCLWLMLLAACSSGSNHDDAANVPRETCARTQCDVEYEQCPKARSLCDRCWDTCEGIEPDLALTCIRTCGDICARDSDTSSPCATALTRCRSTAKDKVCREASEETAGAGNASESADPVLHTAGGGSDDVGPGKSGNAGPSMNLPAGGASGPSSSDAPGRAGEAAGGASGPNGSGAPSRAGSAGNAPSPSGSSSGGGSSAPSGQGGRTGSAGDAPSPQG